MSRLTLVAAVLALICAPTLALAQCSGGECATPVSAKADIVDTAIAAGKFETLVAAVKAADLVGALKSKGPFTVFAPTDQAFSKLPKGTVENLLKPENKKALQGVLTYHVVPGRFMAAQVIQMSGAVTLNGQRMDFSASDNGVTIDGARVVASDIECSNGIIHIIDRVILPSSDSIVATAKKAGSFGTLLAAAQAAGLAKTLSEDGPFTVFAPTDAAFAKLPKGTVETLLMPENKAKLAAILKYHVVAGRIYAKDALAAAKAKTLEGQSVKIRIESGKPMVQNAQIVATDIDASNGVIHVIDTVILPATTPRPANASRN